MSAREELAELLQDNITDALPIHPWRGEIREQVELAVQHVLAAGYTKQRTVATVEELDALPVGSVVLHGGRTFQHYPAYPAPFDEYQKWKCPDGGFVRSTKDGTAILPATVLYSPEVAE